MNKVDVLYTIHLYYFFKLSLNVVPIFECFIFCYYFLINKFVMLFSYVMFCCF